MRDSQESGRAERRKNRPNQNTRHHLVPRSRCRFKTSGVKGVKTVSREFHEAWHILFGNMMPHEVVICIVRLWAPVDYFTRVELAAEWEKVHYEFHFESDAPPDFEPGYQILNYQHTILKFRAEFEKLFPNKSWDMIVAEILTAWAPPNYFCSFQVEGKYHRGNRLERFKISSTSI
jgi:hypothetical protein